MPDFFEEIKAVQWLLAFFTLHSHLLRNLQLLMCCVIFGETCWYGPKTFFGVLKICGGIARFFEEIKAVQWPLAFLTYSLGNLPLVLGLRNIWSNMLVWV